MVKLIQQSIFLFLIPLIFHSCDSNSQRRSDNTGKDSIKEEEIVSDTLNSINKDIIKYNLTDKSVRVLWRETKYSEEYKTDINTIVLDENYLSTISEPEKAVLGLASTFIGNECEWDGKADENRSNLKCKVLWALNLGYQCSPSHLDFLRKWFRGDKEIIESLEACPTMPDGATIQDTFDEINMDVKGSQIIISFKASGFNLREARGWDWTEKHTYKLEGDQLLLVDNEITPKVQKTIEVGEG